MSIMAASCLTHVTEGWVRWLNRCVYLPCKPYRGCSIPRNYWERRELSPKSLQTACYMACVHPHMHTHKLIIINKIKIKSRELGKWLCAWKFLPVLQKVPGLGFKHPCLVPCLVAYDSRYLKPLASMCVSEHMYTHSCKHTHRCTCAHTWTCAHTHSH